MSHAWFLESSGVPAQLEAGNVLVLHNMSADGEDGHPDLARGAASLLVSLPNSKADGRRFVADPRGINITKVRQRTRGPR
jgi:hypothetical protein